MARPSNITEHEPDVERLIKLVLTAKGIRTQREYAEECGVSNAHLSRLINNNNKNVPSVSFLYKLAEKAQNNISFDELLDAAGYDPDIHRSDVNRGHSGNAEYKRGFINKEGQIVQVKPAAYAVSMDEIFNALIAYVVKEAQYNINIIAEERDEHSLTLEFDSPNLKYNMWHFLVRLPGDEDSVFDVRMLLKMMSRLKSECKISFVSPSAFILNSIRERSKKYACDANATCILLRSDSAQIGKEAPLFQEVDE